MLLSVAPIDAFAAIATIPIRDPIIAYSMAVTPRLSVIRLDRSAIRVARIVRMGVVPKKTATITIEQARSRSNVVKVPFNSRELVLSPALNSETERPELRSLLSPSERVRRWPRCY
jgi:hypothetical protein